MSFLLAGAHAENKLLKQAVATDWETPPASDAYLNELLTCIQENCPEEYPAVQESHQAVCGGDSSGSGDETSSSEPSSASSTPPASGSQSSTSDRPSTTGGSEDQVESPASGNHAAVPMSTKVGLKGAATMIFGAIVGGLVVF
ncbi:hypothetical protein AX16_010758 [Volvariella volvacea WC 439]|nr:hypothetical protein AX16_010758 [Volvariella volvacea WC 439]